MELNFPNPVILPHDYFDRENELRTGWHALARPDPIIPLFLGERKIGKTSTLNVFTTRYRDRARFLSLPFAFTVDDWLREMADGLLDLLFDPTVPETYPSTETVDLSTVQTWARRLVERERVPVVFYVDEIDSLFTMYDEKEGERLIDLLLTLLPDPHIRFLFSATRTVETLPPGRREIFQNHVHPIPLRPWPEPTTREFIQWLVGPTYTFTDDALALLYQAGGGHPYFTKAILHNLLQGSESMLEETTITAALVQRAMDRLPEMTEVAHMVHNLLEVHFSEEERDILKASARGRPVTGPAAARLAERGYLHEGTFTLRVGVLRHWL